MAGPASAPRGRHPGVHVDAVTWRDAVGPVHLSRRRNDRPDRGVLDRRAAVVAAALPGRRPVEGGRSRQGAYGRETNAFSARRVHAGEDDGAAHRGDDDARGGAGAGRVARRSRPGAGAAGDLARRPRRSPLRDDVLEWTIVLANQADRPVEIGDLAVPFAFAERAGARGDIYTKKLLRHSLVAGHGSWIYWERSNAVGPYLVMTPVGRGRSSSTSTAPAARSRRTCTRRPPAPRRARPAATGGCRCRA